MKNSILVVLTCTVILAACAEQAQPVNNQATESRPASAAETAKAAPAAQAPKPTSPERIAEIEATGKTGVWASVTEVCPSDVKAGVRTTLTWNVKESGAERVILYVVDQNGSERNFAQGKAVGERETGPWLRPGLTFKVRNYETKDELGSVVIGEKSC